MKKLKETRNELLSLHKTLMNIERESYESKNGSVTNVELLTLLLENENFTWLREISSLVAEIDELLANKEGINEESSKLLLTRAKDLVREDSDNKNFRAKYQANLNTEVRVATHHNNLQTIFKNEEA